MKRIATLNGYWDLQPSPEDFKALNTKIILTRLLVMYVLNADNKVQMLHEFQVHEIAGRMKAQLNLKDILCNYIEALPEDVWHEVENFCLEVK
jgi:hypothetical protein